MRKLGFILLLAVSCLFTTGGGPKAHASRAVQSAVLSIDRAAADEWRCERICNSDLNVPRVLQEVTPVQASATSFRGAADTERLSLRHAAAGRGAGSLKATSCFNFPISVFGVRAADYYVFRLRRLII